MKKQTLENITCLFIIALGISFLPSCIFVIEYSQDQQEISLLQYEEVNDMLNEHNASMYMKIIEDKIITRGEFEDFKEFYKEQQIRRLQLEGYNKVKSQLRAEE